MSIYQQNMEVIKKRFPTVADKIAGAPRKNVIFLQNTQKGLITAQVIINNKAIWAHSSVDPLKEAERIVKPLLDAGTLIYCIFGTGLGYTAHEILRKKDSRAILVICEPDAGGLKDLLHRIDLSWLFQDVSVLLYCGEPLEIAAGLRGILLTPLFSLITHVDYVVSSYIRQFYVKWAEETRYHLQNTFRNAYMAIGNDIDDTIVGMRQMLQNAAVCLNNPGINSLKNAFTKTPAIVVSAGPSLQKNVHLLHEAKGKALIFAVDTTLRPLLKMGLIPDAVFVVERFPNVYECHFKDLEIPEEVALIGLPLIFPPIFQSVRGPKLISFRKSEALNEWMNIACGDKGVLYIGGSVAHQAFSFARYVGADPIVLIGQDLAYAEDGSTHSAGTVYDGQKIKLDESENTHPDHRLYTVPGYYGKPVQTCFYLRDFLIWFENQIQKTKVRCINATEGGALINGAENMPLREVLKRFCRKDLKETFLSKIKTIPIEEKEASKQRLLCEVSDLEKAFLNAADVARQATENFSPSKSLPGFLWDSGVEDQLVKISDENTGFLRQTLSHNVVVHLIQPLLASIMSRLNNLGAMDNVEKKWQALHIQYAYFNQVKEVAELVARELQQSCRQLEQLEF